MIKLQFYIPFNININNLNCNEYSKCTLCSLIKEYLSKEFSYLIFIHSPTQSFKGNMVVDDVYTDGIIITVSSNDICSVDETTLTIISNEIEEKYIPEINEMLAKKSNYFTLLPTTAKFAVMYFAYNNIKIADDAWKPAEENLITGTENAETVDAALIQCIPKVELYYKGEEYNV